MKDNITALDTTASTLILNFRNIDFMNGYWKSLTEEERLLVNEHLATMAALQTHITSIMRTGQKRFVDHAAEVTQAYNRMVTRQRKIGYIK
jgi:hypothetical protein